MKIVKGGWAVVNDDSHFSIWIEATGRIDHNSKIEEHFNKWLKPGDIAIDVGACLGDHTVPYARLVGEAGHVYAFEPNPEAFECLVYNTRNLPQVTCFNFGLSGSEQDVGFKRIENLGASYIDESSNSKIHLKTLDSLLASHDLGKVKFMKIDVEGWELSVLKGATEFFKICKPILMLEVCDGHQSRYGHSENDIYKWLDENNYAPGLDADNKESIRMRGQPQYDLVAYPK